MLVLDSTNKSITAFLTSTPTKNPDFVATYAEASGNSFVEGSSDGALNGTTAVTLVAAPSSGVRRVVKEIIIYNRNTSSVTLTVWYVNGANGRMLWSGTLQPAETWTLSRHVLSMANWQNIGSGAPTVNDDSTRGYVIGSRWVDTTNGQVYVCVSATAGAAVWRNLSSALSASDGNPATAAYCDNDGRLKADYGADVTGTLTATGNISSSSGFISPLYAAGLRSRQITLAAGASDYVLDIGSAGRAAGLNVLYETSSGMTIVVAHGYFGFNVLGGSTGYLDVWSMTDAANKIYIYADGPRLKVKNNYSSSRIILAHIFAFL